MLNSNFSEDILQFLPSPNEEKVLAIGFGTAGCRMLSNIEKKNNGIDSFAYISCEKKDLDFSQSGQRLLIDIGFDGKSTPSHVRGVAHKYIRDIRKTMCGARLVFLVAGLGGCAGSGLIPLFAEVAKEEGILTVSVLVMPFGFEKSKHFYAGTSLNIVKKISDAVIIIDNDVLSNDELQMPIPKIHNLINERISDALFQIIESTGELSLGLNKVIDIIKNNNISILGIGTSSSINKAEEATVRAAESVYGVVEPEEASKAILHLVGDKNTSASQLNTSTSRLNSLLGNGSLEISQGFSSEGGNTMTAILLASGFRKTKFDEYDPLDKILRHRRIDSEIDGGLDEEFSTLVQMENT
jgi:cell division protein FtsZ